KVGVRNVHTPHSSDLGVRTVAWTIACTIALAGPSPPLALPPHLDVSLQDALDVEVERALLGAGELLQRGLEARPDAQTDRGRAGFAVLFRGAARHGAVMAR